MNVVQRTIVISSLNMIRNRPWYEFMKLRTQRIVTPFPSRSILRAKIDGASFSTTTMGNFSTSAVISVADLFALNIKFTERTSNVLLDVVMYCDKLGIRYRTLSSGLEVLDHYCKSVSGLSVHSTTIARCSSSLGMLASAITVRWMGFELDVWICVSLILVTLNFAGASQANFLKRSLWAPLCPPPTVPRIL
ncbi:hypothetical protein GQ600_27305 [Phytophthora cactorum]|nr:hypothetical protein GQ600_27305 [Phytophthora cactorum]